MNEYYRHTGTVPMVGEHCGPHQNEVGQVVVIGLSEYRQRTFVTFIGYNTAADVMPLEQFNYVYKFRSTQP